LIIYSFLLVGLITLNGSLIAMTLPFIIFLAAAYLLAPGAPQLALRRTFSESYVVPGKDVEVSLIVANQGREPQEILVMDHVPEDLELLDGATQLLTLVPPGEEVKLTYTVRGQRGGFYFRPVRLTAYDRLGLFIRNMILEAPGQILIKPDVNRLRPLAIRPPRTHGFTGAIPGRRGGSGTSFFGVREYQMGDQQRRINWKSTARHANSIYTNEFERERVADVGLILDARQRTDIVAPKGSLFEHGISATAALADMFLQAGNRVGMLIYGRGQEATFPGYGKVQREKILRSLAQAATGDNMALESFTYIPTRLFPARSQIVIISPLCQDDLPVLARLRSYGYQLLVVSPNPVTYEASVYSFDQTQPLAVRMAALERQVLLRRLQRAAIVVVDWSVDQPFSQALYTAVGRSAGQVTRGGFHL
jgi:uncharacterized protein (DUF58 family)